MTSMDELVKQISEALQAREKKTAPLDTTAKVKRVDREKGIAWVQFTGGIDETPVRLTVDAKAGDSVQVRSSKGRAWLTGNQTAPPTDDKTAKKALTVGSSAIKIAKQADEKVTTVKERIEDGEFTPSETVIQYCLATSNVIPSGGTFDDIQYTDWSEELPEYQAGYYYWMRTVVVMEDGTDIESDPVFYTSAQVAAEANDVATSMNNHFWNDNTGAWVTKVDQASYKQQASGPATQMGASGFVDYIDGVMLASRTASGTTFYANDNGVSKELVSYGLNGTVFNDDYPFTIGNASGDSYIKWYKDTSVTPNKWKIAIAADTILMGGSPIHDGEDGGRWYTGTGITGISTTPTVFSESGITKAVVGDMYLNTSTSNTYRCTLGGNASTAKWVYENNIEGGSGRGVSSTTVTYASSSSGTTPPSSGWSSSVPSVSEGNYLWTKTVFNYTDGTSSNPVYSKARQGEDGQDKTSQYMFFNSTGSYVGLNIKYTNYNNRVVLNSSGLDVYDGSSNKVATFGSTVYVGNTSSAHVKIAAGGFEFNLPNQAVKIDSSGGWSAPDMGAFFFNHPIMFSGNYGIQGSNIDGNLYIAREYKNGSTWENRIGNGDTKLYLVGSSISANHSISTSDIRVKDHIKPVDYASDIILNLDAFEFKWITGLKQYEEEFDNYGHFGVSAQQLKELMERNGIITELYDGVDCKSKYYGVQYTALIPLMIRTIQDLNEKINNLERRS